MGGYEADKSSFRQAVRQINELDCDFVVICGDLVHHASDSTNADFKDIAEDLKVPVYLVAGNHDVGNNPTDSSLAVYRSGLGKDYYKFTHKGIRFVVTNTQLFKSDVEEESAKQEQWLKDALEPKKRKQGRFFVIGHHPLFVKQADEDEEYFNLPPVKRQELMELFEAGRVVAYLSGHKHELLVHNYRGMQLVTGESTAKNFDGRPLGFRHWQVDPDTLYHQFVPLDPNQEADVKIHGDKVMLRSDKQEGCKN
jgi:3',5'-cyclic AMP phosphodiesterase CpdA